MTLILTQTQSMFIESLLPRIHGYSQQCDLGVQIGSCFVITWQSRQLLRNRKRKYLCSSFSLSLLLPCRKILGQDVTKNKLLWIEAYLARIFHLQLLT